MSEPEEWGPEEGERGEVDLTPDMRDVLREYEDARETIRQHKERSDKARDQLLAFLEANDATTGLVSGEPAVRGWHRMVERFDSKRFAAEHPELSRQYRYRSAEPFLRAVGKHRGWRDG